MFPYIRWYLAAIFCLLQGISMAQYSGMKFTHITASEGLSQGSVTAFCQDEKGFIWIGTRDGLNRFDGYTFTVYKNNPEDPSSLSNNHITGIIKTGDDHLWIATWGGGVNLFDLKKQRFVRSFAGNAGAAVPRLFVHSLMEDVTGNLWIGTDGQGLYRFSKKTGRLTHYIHRPDDAGSIPDNTIRTIYEDREKNIWIGTQHGGLARFDTGNNSFIHVRPTVTGKKFPSGDHIRAIAEIGEQYLAIGNYGNGLDILDRKTGKSVNFRHLKSENSLCHDNILSLMCDKSGNLWIGTENGGLSILDMRSMVFQNYRNDALDNSCLNNNSIYTIFEDKNRNIWLGTWNGGINLVHQNAQQFRYFRHNSSPGSLSDNHILCLTEDSAGFVWVGTDGGGLNMMDPVTGKFTRYLNDEKNPNSLAGNYVLSVCEAKNGELWIGTYGNGISIYNKEKKTFRNIKYEPGKAGGITSNYIWVIYRDSEDKMWIGMCPGGLNVYDPNSGMFTYFIHNENDSNSLIHNNIHSIFEDNNGNMWIGTNGGGLDKIDRKTSKIKHHKHIPGKNSLSHNCLGHLFEDRQGNLWIGTDAGLDFLNTRTGRITNYGPKFGLPNSFIYGILEDSKQCLWISSNEGIIRFNPESKDVKYFTIADGLQSNEFNLNAFCLGRNGAMYFGGSNGFNLFYPDSLKEASSNYSLAITDFQVYNKSVSIDAKGSPLHQDIAYTRNITLPYGKSVFSFEFAALNYLAPGSNQYAYIMEGFDKEWNYIRSKRTATYTNLDPGEYTFMVRTGLTDDLNKKSIEMKVLIVPPFRMTMMFKILVILGLSGFIILIYWNRLRTIKRQNTSLERKVIKRTSEIMKMNILLQTQSQELNSKNLLLQERHQQIEDQAEELTLQKNSLIQMNKELKEANATKDKFFSIIAHDLKNPFNSILGLSELMVKNYKSWKDEKVLQMLVLMNNSSQNLFNLLENLLQWARSQRNIIEFEPEMIEFENVMNECRNLFRNSLKEKNIRLTVSFACQKISVYADRQMLNTTMRNLISNAIKFTPDGGQIKITACSSNGMVHISVTDDGTGMSASHMEQIFRIDSNHSTHGTNREKGTGLGLILVKEFISRHDGTIRVESEEGKGSTFTISLPFK